MTKKQVSITIDADMYHVLKALATADERSVRSWLGIHFKALAAAQNKPFDKVKEVAPVPVPVPVPRGCSKEDLEMEARIKQHELELAIKGGYIWDPNCSDYVDRIPEDGHAACRELTPANQRIKVARSATARALLSHIWDPNINKYVGRLPEDGEEKMLPVL